MHKNRGFTLIELMVSVAILAIFLAIAVPELGGFIRTSKVRSAQSELIAALMLARSEAVKRGRPASVKANATVPGNPFGSGWTVWIDSNGDGVVDAAEETVRRYPDISAGVVVTADANLITFAPNGFVAGAATVNFKVCGNGGSAKGFAVQLQPAGFTDLNDQATCP